MARSWRSQIADEVRATSMMKPKEPYPEEAQAEITRLRVLLERREKLLTSCMMQRATARNDALEEAAALGNKPINEGGLAKSMAFFTDVADYKSYKQGVHDYTEAIRAMKTQS